MTRRDLQRMMSDQQKPWELGKAFDKSAVITHPLAHRRF
jgi:2-keto-4-pentenoate hydratase/2-oxohepta-3-ene-1,7-dioic acid hydratase in catechol pathway